MDHPDTNSDATEEPSPSMAVGDDPKWAPKRSEQRPTATPVTSERTVLGYMPQVFQDESWVDLLNQCVGRLSAARTVTGTVRLTPTRIVERTVADRVVK